MGALVLYGWILGATAGLPRIAGRQNDYNNLLVHGLLKGHLYLDAPVPAPLLALKNPYDPAQRPFGLGLHDASLYHGRYYIYFGPAPALLLMLPFAALTGNDLPVGYAVGILVAGMSAALLAIFRHYLRLREPPATGRLVPLACTVALLTCGFQLVLLSRHTMYELAIAGGACFFLWSLYFLLRAAAKTRPPSPSTTLPVQAGAPEARPPSPPTNLSVKAGVGGARPPGALAPTANPPRNAPGSVADCTAAGLTLGLAIASRPIYLFTAPLLFLLLLRPRGFRPFAFAAASCALVVAALLLYNHARFGRFSEFGQSYQLSGAIEGQVRHFAIANVPFNLRVYFLSPLRYGRYFPFVHPIEVPPYPPGFGSYEEAFGLLPNFPFYLLAALGLWFAAVEAGTRRFRKPDLLVIAVAGLILTTVLALFFGSVVRYEADFCGPLLLLACCGAAELDSRLKSGAARPLFAGLTVAAAAFSAFVAVMTGVTLYHDFASASPGQSAWLTRWLSVPGTALEQIGLLARPGPRALQVRLSPPAGSPPREPILTTGWTPQTDSLWAVYPKPGYVRFQWVHGSAGILAVSPEYELGSNPDHDLAVVLGSLYPPDHAPYYCGLSGSAIGADRTAWSVTLDHQPTWHLTAGFFDSTPGTVRYGPAVNTVRSDGSGRGSLRGFRARFELPPPRARWNLKSNLLEGDRSQPATNPPLEAAKASAILATYRLPTSRMVLKLTLQASWAGRTFPLATRGRTYAGDTLFIHLVDERTVTFGYDHWSHPALVSPPIPWVMGRPLQLTIDLPVPSPNQGRGVIALAAQGHTLWQPEVSYYAAEFYEIFAAQNLIGSTSCESLLPDCSVRFEPERLQPVAK